MNILSLVRDYLFWHYSSAYRDFFYIWSNYLWFVNHLFSVPDVVMSWISPFKRLEEGKANILLHPEDFFSGLFINFIMRLVGFFLRSALITIALACFCVVLIGGVMFLVLWTILPILTADIFITGITQFFS